MMAEREPEEEREKKAQSFPRVPIAVVGEDVVSRNFFVRLINRQPDIRPLWLYTKTRVAHAV